MSQMPFSEHSVIVPLPIWIMLTLPMNGCLKEKVIIQECLLLALKPEP